ncbi:MAG: hypothetical protein KA354_13625 [Phycisphaerae bacterium]|nr:hypothetical protein [Phycisphaerae bacterium]
MSNLDLIEYWPAAGSEFTIRIRRWEICIYSCLDETGDDRSARLWVEKVGPRSGGQPS